MIILDKKSYFLNEEYHRRTDFNEALDDISKKVVNIIIEALNASFAKEHKEDLLKAFSNYNEKYIQTDYSYILNTDKEKFSINVISNEGNKKEIGKQIFLKIFRKDNQTLFSCYLEKENIILDCNIIALCKLYLQFYNLYSYKTDVETKQIVSDAIRNKIAHELNGHAIQEIGKSLSSKAYSKFDKKTEELFLLIDKEDIAENDKDLLKMFFYYFLPTEIQARLSEIDYVLRNISKLDILKASKQNYEVLNETTLKSCLSLIDDASKIDQINSLYTILNDKSLLSHILALDKFQFFHSNIEKTMKTYEAKVLKQIYYILKSMNYGSKNSDIINEKLLINDFFHLNLDKVFEEIS